MEGARSVLEISIGKLASNYAKLKRRAAGMQVMPVLKADAYHLGVAKIYEVLADAGFYGVATVPEALEIISFGGKALVLGGLLDEEIAPAVAGGVVCPAVDLESARKLDAEAARQDRTVEVELPVDSGMGRVGMRVDRALPEILEIVKLPRLKVRGIYSHLSCAATPGDPYSRRQITVFRNLVRKLAAANVTFEHVHIGASDAFANFDAAEKSPFTLMRVGISLYGFNNNPAHYDLKLEPVAELKSRLIAARTLKAGTCIGYSRMHTLPKNTRVGTVAIGYDDGLPLALSNRGYLLVRGQLCPILGRVAMDYVMISLENVPEACPGDEVVCFGRQGEREIPLSSWAALKGTHNHEVLCSIGNRVRRKYV